METIQLAYHPEDLQCWRARDPADVPPDVLEMGGDPFVEGRFFGEYLVARDLNNHGYQVFWDNYDQTAARPVARAYGNAFIAAAMGADRFEELRTRVRGSTLAGQVVTDVDVCAVCGNDVIFVDAKMPKDYVRPQQARLFAMVEALGCRAMIVKLYPDEHASRVCHPSGLQESAQHLRRRR